MQEKPGEDHNQCIDFANYTESEAQDGTWQRAAVARCLNGDESAFAIIADYYGNLLLRTAYLLLQDEESAKDVVQEAFLLAWRNLEKLREPAFLRAWLLKIVVNRATSLKRQFARKATILRAQFAQQSIDISIQQADAQRGHTEEMIDLEQTLKQLPSNQRTVVVLFYYHKMTIPEIGDLLDVSENTLRKRLQAALKKLRRGLLVETGDPTLKRDSIHSGISMHRGGTQ